MCKYPYVAINSCEWCKGEIIIKRKRDVGKVFCGTGCSSKARLTKPVEYVKCNYCSLKFKKTSKTQNKYCSYQCSGKSKEIIHNRVCKGCGNIFILKNIADERRGKGLYCSKDCQTKYARKYFYDVNFFKTIDTPEKAYWLGFIYADGCLSKNELILHLGIKDEEHLNKFKKAIKSNGKIEINETHATFRISSKEISYDLIKLGVLRRKTFIIKYPNLLKNLERHFIRGYFDGDGCISNIKNKNSKTWSIFGASESFMFEMKNRLETLLGFPFLIYLRKKGGYNIQLNKKEHIIKMENFLYDGVEGEVYLIRKKNNFSYNK